MNQQGKIMTPYPSAEQHMYLALVTKVNGDGRYNVDAIVPQGKNVTVETYLAVLPGRLRRIARSVKNESWVLIQLWDFCTTVQKADLIHLYSDFEVQNLRQAGFMLKDQSYDTSTTIAEEDESHKVDIEAI